MQEKTRESGSFHILVTKVVSLSSTTRKDAIDQELKVGDIVKPFAKSGHDIPIAIVTRFTPKMTQLNGRDLYDDNRLVVITDNLLAVGRQQEVDELRQKYAGSLDATVKEVKIPIRFMVIGTPTAQDPKIWAIRYEHRGRELARDVLISLRDEFKARTGVEATHSLLYSGREGTLNWGRMSIWNIQPAIRTWRSLPGGIASLMDDSVSMIEVPAGHLTETYRVL